MKKVKIFVDTSADLPEEAAKEYDIDVINFLCYFGDEGYVAGEELSNEEFYGKLKETGIIPKTSQTPPAVMYETLKKAAEENDIVVFYTISSRASGQYQNAVMNAKTIMEENPEADVRIIDTMSFSVYITETAIYLRKLLRDGVEPDEAIERSKEMLGAIENYILVDDLTFLQKGGRITKTAAIVGNLLDIKPVLAVKNGLIEPVEKLRGKKKLYQKLCDLARENPDFDPENPDFCVVDSNSEYGDKMLEVLKEEFGIEKIRRRYKFGVIVGAHIGDGAVAFTFQKKGYKI